MVTRSVSRKYNPPPSEGISANENSDSSEKFQPTTSRKSVDSVSSCTGSSHAYSIGFVRWGYMNFQEAGNNCGLVHSCGRMCTTDPQTIDSSKATVSDYCVLSLSFPGYYTFLASSICSICLLSLTIVSDYCVCFSLSLLPPPLPGCCIFPVTCIQSYDFLCSLSLPLLLYCIRQLLCE